MNVRDAAVVARGKAAKLESGGPEFCPRSAGRAENPAAKAIFLALAEDERDHVRRVREIFEELKDKPGWPEVSARAARRSWMVHPFEPAPAGLGGVAAAEFFRRLAAEEEVHLATTENALLALG